MKIIEKRMNRAEIYEISNFQETGIYLITVLDQDIKEYHFANLYQSWSVFLGIHEELKSIFEENTTSDTEVISSNEKGQLSENFVLELVRILTK